MEASKSKTSKKSSIAKGEKSQDFFPNDHVDTLNRFIDSNLNKYEIEAKFKNVSKRQFYKLLKFFSEHSKNFEKRDSFSKTYLSTQQGYESYMKIEMQDDTIYRLKNKKAQISVPQWGYNISKSTEENLSEPPKDIKYGVCREKTRVSFLDTNGKSILNHLSVDLTIVRILEKDKAPKIVYEVEVERIDKTTSKNFLYSLKFIYLLMQGYDHVIYVENYHDMKKAVKEFFPYAMNIDERLEKIKSFNDVVSDIDKLEFTNQLKGEIIQKYFPNETKDVKKELKDIFDFLINTEGKSVNALLTDERIKNHPKISKVIDKNFIFDLNKVSQHRKSKKYDVEEYNAELETIINHYLKPFPAKRGEIIRILKNNLHKSVFSAMNILNKTVDNTIKYAAKEPQGMAGIDIAKRNYELTVALEKFVKKYTISYHKDNELRIYRNNSKNITTQSLISETLSGKYAVTSKLDGTRAFLMIGNGVYIVIAPEDIVRVSKTSYKDVSILDGELLKTSYYAFDAIYSELYKGVPSVQYMLFYETAEGTKEEKEETWNKMSKKEKDAYHVSRQKFEEYTKKKEEYTPATDVFYSHLTKQLLKRRLDVVNKVLSKNIQSKLNIYAKDFFMANNFYENVNKAFTENLQYKSKGIATDGIILQPIDKPYMNEATKKWKPAADMTIDFLVRGTDIFVNAKSGQKRFEGSRKFPYKQQLKFTELNGISLEEKIVEFKWENNQFVPIRFRFDRTIPNKEDVAIADWHDINNPIAESTIRGQDLVATRGFHNNIKRAWLNKIPKGSTILDIGSGRGGDLGKWAELNLKVIAVEPDEQNIEEIKRRNRIYKVPIQIIHAKIEETEKIVSQMTTQVDAVISFFSATFLQENEDVFDGFIQTVDRVLKKGGLLLGAVMDGERVYNLFTTGNDEYSNSAFSLEKVGKWNEGNYGNKLVTTINDATTMVKDVKEYLFFFDLFRQKLSREGIRIFEPKLSENDYEAIEDRARTIEIGKQIQVIKNKIDKLYKILSNTTELQKIEKEMDLIEKIDLNKDNTSSIHEDLKDLDMRLFRLRPITAKEKQTMTEKETKEYAMNIGKTMEEEINKSKKKYHNLFIDRGISELPEVGQEFSKLMRLFIFEKKYVKTTALLANVRQDTKVNVYLDEIHDIFLVQSPTGISEQNSLIGSILTCLSEKFRTTTSKKEKLVQSTREKLAKITLKQYKELGAGTFAKELNARFQKATEGTSNYEELALAKFRDFLRSDEWISDTLEIIELLSNTFDVNIFLVSGEGRTFYLPTSEVLIPIKTKVDILYKNRSSIILASLADGSIFQPFKKDESFVFGPENELIQRIRDSFYEGKKKSTKPIQKEFFEIRPKISPYAKTIEEIPESVKLIERITKKKDLDLSGTDIAIYKRLGKEKKDLRNKWGANIKSLTTTKRAQNRIDDITEYLSENVAEYLDIGAGNCEIAYGIGNFLKANIHAIDIDRKNCGFAFREKYDFKVVDEGKPLPYKNQSMDLITAFQTFHHMQDFEFKIMEIKRVLKNGGMLIVREHDCINDDVAKLINIEHMIYEFYYEKQLSAEPATAEEEAKKIMREYYARYFDKKKLEYYLNRVGFEKVAEKEATIGNNSTRIYYSVYIAKIDDYPYKRLYMKEKDVLRKIENTNRYIVKMNKGAAPIFNIPRGYDKLLKFDGEYQYMKIDRTDYEKMDDISYFFIEELIVKCRRSDQSISSFEYWMNNKEFVHKYSTTDPTFLKKHGHIKNSNQRLRDAMWDLHKECTTFKSYLVVGLLKLFDLKNVKMLDFSSGWGDRLIGALSYDDGKNAYVETYCGVDPNPGVHVGYKQIDRFFKKHYKTRTNTIFIQKPFEDAVLPDMQFDIVLTSPPYFDLEVYSEDEGQSIVGKSAKEWFENFLIPSLDKSIRALKVEGYLVININNASPDKDYVIEMVNIINQRSDVQYLGCLPQWTEQKNKSAQPFWIWQKVKGTYKPSQLENTTIDLAKITDKGVKELQNIANQPSVRKYVKKINIEELRKWSIEDAKDPKRKYYHWAIIADRKPVGYIGIHPFGEKRSQLRFFIDENYRGYGITPRAIEEVFLFLKSLGVKRIYSVNDVKNIEANKLSSKLMKMKKEGANLFDDGKTYNVYVKNLKS